VMKPTSKGFVCVMYINNVVKYIIKFIFISYSDIFLSTHWCPYFTFPIGVNLLILFVIVLECKISLTHTHTHQHTHTHTHSPPHTSAHTNTECQTEKLRPSEIHQCVSNIHWTEG